MPHNFTSQTTLLTMFLLTEIIVIENASGYGKDQSISLLMYIHQKKTAHVCKNFLHFWSEVKKWCILSTYQI